MEISALLNRYFWLADLIYRRGKITRDEINRSWRQSALNIDGDTEIPERTFHRHKEAVRNLFGMEIVCDKGSERAYYIRNRSEIESGGTVSWLFNSFAVGNLIQNSSDLRDRIVFEDIPSGREYLSVIMDAMRQNVRLRLTYRGFYSEKERSSIVAPYCLKVFRQRWYMLGLPDGEDKKVRVYALDRITDISLTDSWFELPRDFDAETCFADCFGVIIGGPETAQTVEIEARDGQQHYLRSVPLHHSQQETVHNEYRSTFTFYIRPTYDFVQELMRFGNGIEVVRPLWLRDLIRKIAVDMLASYSEVNGQG